MDLRLTEDDRALQERAREFTRRHLFPYELECERDDGLAPDRLAEIRSAVVEWRFNAINHAPEDGARATTCSSKR